MTHEIYVLDTSALLTLMEDEAGAERVAEVLRVADVILPWVVLMEAYYVIRREQGEAEAGRRYALTREMGAAILWEMDEPTLLSAARMKADHRLSLADAVIAAVAQRHGATLLHKDPEYELVQDEVNQERLPYKGSASG